jgi:hypothetical protein
MVTVNVKTFLEGYLAIKPAELPIYTNDGYKVVASVRFSEEEPVLFIVTKEAK